MARYNSLPKGVLAATLTVAFALFIANAANAGGRGSVKDAAPGYAPWAGKYVGLHVGGGFGQVEHTSTQSRRAARALNGSYEIEGVVWGGTLGYNWQNGRTVWGLETDISISDVEGSSRKNCPGNCLSSIDWLWTLRGRVGYDTGAILPYLTAGLAVADVNSSISTRRGLSIGSASETVAGYTFGAGIELRLSQSMTLKGEYLYVSLDDIKFSEALRARRQFDFETKLDILRVGLNLRF